MADLEVRLRRLNREYPCDKRRGVGTSGCCNQPKVKDVNAIDCELHGRSIYWNECMDCPYQENHPKK